MMSNKLLLSFFGVSACLVVGTVGRLSGEEIIGGEIADDYQFPYQVSLHYYARISCGGGIIGDQFILTAAHCVVNNYGEFRNMSIRVVAGTNDQNDTSNAVSVSVVKIYVPPDFLPEIDSAYADIAVLKLEKPLGLSTNKNLKKLELPTDPSNTYVNETLIIAGYGWDWVIIDNYAKESGGKNDTVLRFADADVISNEDCQSGYAVTRVYEAQICARTKQRDYDQSPAVCSGDSGGPLVYNGKTVVGILSRSPTGCKESVSAAIYTRVSSFLKFINDAMNDDMASGKIRTLELTPPKSLDDRSTSSVPPDEPNTEFRPDNWWVWT